MLAMLMLMLVHVRKADGSYGRLAGALAVSSPAEPGEGWYLPRKALSLLELEVGNE